MWWTVSDDVARFPSLPGTPTCLRCGGGWWPGISGSPLQGLCPVEDSNDPDSDDGEQTRKGDVVRAGKSRHPEGKPLAGREQVQPVLPGISKTHMSGQTC